VQAVDYSGEARAEGGDRVEVDVAVGGGGEGGGGEGPAAADVTDNGDGTYLCAYTAAAEGAALLHVRVCGEAVRGSPFKLAVGPAKSCLNLTMDPQRKGPQMVLSNANRTVTNNGSGHQTVLATESFNSGRHYWETHIDKSGSGASSGGHVRLGIAAAQANLSTHIGDGAVNAIGIYDNHGEGNLNLGGVAIAFVPALVGNDMGTGVTVGFLLDLDANELSIYKNRQFKSKTKIAPGTYHPAFCTYDPSSAATVQHDVAFPNE
jgi:hypothetical protein